MKDPDTYFANAIVRVDPLGRGQSWLAVVLCGCGCGEEGMISRHGLEAITKHYRDELRGALITLQDHGPGLHTGDGFTIWLAPAPPRVVYVDDEAISAGGIVAAANAALRGLALGGLRA